NAGQIIAYTSGVNSHALLLTPEAPAPGPEVQVWIDGREMANNTGSIDFGSTRLGASVARTISVRNVGDQPLLLSGPITLPNGLSLVSSFNSTTLAPGGT